MLRHRHSSGGSLVSQTKRMLRHRAAALCLLCLAAVLFLPTSPCACCRHTERDSLFSFLSNISTPADRPLRSWAANTDCCLWEGISCNSDGSVTRLWLPQRGLGGTLFPSSLDGLPRLADLNLSHNRLSGTLPQGLLWSDHIVVLDVSYNLLSGRLPPPPPPPGLEEDSASRPIRSLIVSNNGFFGPIPLSICSVAPSLNLLDFSRNEFDGVIPPGLGNCSELLVLDAGFNQLSGPLPADLYDAIQLHRLSLPFNQLSGVLHGEHISKLANLVVLDLGGNSLRWEAPEAFGKLTNLEVLHLNQNLLSGTFPSALRNCTKLRSLDLKGNNLTGDISSVDFSPLFKLTTLDLASNHFAGEFPASIYSCTSLTALRLANNTLRGRIAPGMHRLQALSYLSLSFNKLEGIGEALRMLGSCRNLTVVLLGWNFYGEAMPAADADWPVDAFTELGLLSLEQCQLTGKVPSWIARLRKLKILDLPGNQLAGTIPGWLGSLPQLFYVSMSDNLLSGELPSEITGMMALQSDEAVAQVDHTTPFELPFIVASQFVYRGFSSVPPAINLSNNCLSGTIPPGIGLLKGLHVLDLSSNNFSGEIPMRLGDLSELERLNLSRNHLSGPIPDSLSRLHFLSSFSVSFNDLSGRIPSGGQLLTFPSSSFEGNDDLCGVVLGRPCTNISSHLPETKGPRKKIPSGIFLLICLGASSVLIIMVFICAMTIYTHSIP